MFQNKIRKPMLLADGTILSVQASFIHYCVPKTNNAFEYSKMEVGSNRPGLKHWREDFPSDSSSQCHTYIYPYIPVKEIAQLILERGGIVKFDVDWE